MDMVQCGGNGFIELSFSSKPGEKRTPIGTVSAEQNKQNVGSIEDRMVRTAAPIIKTARLTMVCVRTDNANP
jgi:hypothetical protein